MTTTPRASAALLRKALRRALRRALSMQTSGMHHHITAPPSAAARCSCPACVKDHIRQVLRSTK